ncbi:E3 SUMO-protein ligase MMS21 [Acorus calamus]|uniref:E3 SUMO-protein ligase MMS21 n=1 Tax=Acorus calamus TaxID=4465 RepID=A0AAV9F6I5_ACOCL|nr:E3 SUMO-protein ligase MMS21 [Acorus calamus]
MDAATIRANAYESIYKTVVGSHTSLKPKAEDDKNHGFDVDLERDNQSEMARELESSVAELLESPDECTHFSTAIHSLGDSYRPSEQLTDFKKVLENDVVKLKGQSPWQPQSHPLFRQFREVVWKEGRNENLIEFGYVRYAWRDEETEKNCHERELLMAKILNTKNVHHAGQPMPGEEQEDIIMTSTQTNLLNITCPLTGKPVTELQDPVRCNMNDLRKGAYCQCNKEAPKEVVHTDFLTPDNIFSAEKIEMDKCLSDFVQSKHDTLYVEFMLSMDCKHIYEKKAILHYIKTKRPQPQCPVAGCPKVLQAERVSCDPLLQIEIDEMRSRGESGRTEMVEDCTGIDDG